MKAHGYWGHASANRRKGVLVDSKVGNSHSANYVYKVLERCENPRGPDKAPHVPTADTSAVSMFNEKVQVDLLSLDEFIALRAVDLLSEYPLLLPVQPRNSQEVRNVFRSGRSGIFGPPKSIQMGGGGGAEE